MPRTFSDRVEVKLHKLTHDDGTPEIAVGLGGNFIARDLVAMEDYWKLRDVLRDADSFFSGSENDGCPTHRMIREALAVR